MVINVCLPQFKPRIHCNKVKQWGGGLGSGRDAGIRWNYPGGQLVHCSSGIISITALMWHTLNTWGKSPSFAGSHDVLPGVSSLTWDPFFPAIFQLSLCSLELTALDNVKLSINVKLWNDISVKLLSKYFWFHSAHQNLFKKLSFHSNLVFSCKFPHQNPGQPWLCKYCAAGIFFVERPNHATEFGCDCHDQDHIKQVE